MKLRTEIEECYKKIINNQHIKEREDQKRMIMKIVKTLAKKTEKKLEKICIIEAGTGIGKSLAYVLAGINTALYFNKKLCISTSNITLQEQLLTTEIPFFKKNSEIEFKYGVMKGKSNYACLHKIKNLTISGEKENLSELQQKQVSDIIELINNKTWDGDKDNLPFEIETTLWSLINSEKHKCSRNTNHGNCPFYIKKEKMKDWDMVIVNHNLIAADIDLGGGVILPDPEETFYIIDEAHNFPDIFRNTLSRTINLNNSIKLLQKENKNIKKFVDTVNKHSSQQYKCDLAKLYSGLRKMFEYINQRQLCNNENKRYQLKIDDKDPNIISINNIIFHETEKLIDELTIVNKKTIDFGIIEKNRTQPSSIELLIQHLRFISETIYPFTSDFESEETRYTFWIDEIAEKNLQISVAPISVGNSLTKKMWNKAAGVILCSATLRSLGSFNYFSRQIGMQEPINCLHIPSSFNYRRSKLIIPKILNNPNSIDFNNEIIKKMPELVENQQATLVVFSSYKAMNIVAQALTNQIKTKILVQSKHNIQNILEEHRNKCKNNEPSILFGTSSLMEGLNLPGKQLTNLIIVKIPFAVPSSPIELATNELLAKEGKNSFTEVSLPEASRKLIQACGRLIRSEDDTGKVVILDNRIIKKSYGKQLINSLPPFEMIIES